MDDQRLERIMSAPGRATMDDAELRRLIQDATSYANDARAAARYKLSLMQNQETVRIRLKAAQLRIEKAIAEIDRRIEDDANLSRTET